MKNESEIIEYLIDQEKHLSPFAKKSSESLGRKNPIQRDPFRLEFARDTTRILHSFPFRRLKHKTQVFLAPDNDHICTRMEHVLHVSSIASIIGRCLGFNTDLIDAIALGHDLGHAPFGHVGERVLNKIMLQNGFSEGFKHEMHGLRVVDKLSNYGAGLNLTYEVRDGIISHCGENFEQCILPQRSKDLLQLEAITDRTTYPATIEGCLVRMVDRIAYLGRDLEDGITAGLVNKTQIPDNIVKGLGTNNGKILGRLVTDTITNSHGLDSITLSDEVFALMRDLKEFNYNFIYLHPDVERKAQKGAQLLEQLYERLLEIFIQSDRGANQQYIMRAVHDAPALGVFFDFIKNTNYSHTTAECRIVIDYIAGMTDVYAQRCFQQLFLPDPIV